MKIIKCSAHKITLFSYTFILLLSSCTHEMDVSYPNTPMGNFESLWNTIDTKYCFIEEKNIDWNKIHQEYQTKILQLTNSDYDSLFTLLANMLDSLDDGHVNLYSPFNQSRSTKWYKNYPLIFNSDIIYSDKYLTDNYRTAGGMNYNIIPKTNIGYIRYSSFSSTFTNTNIYYILSYFSNCSGLILDVRHNGGGDIENAYKLASVFFQDNTTVGYLIHKTGPQHNDYSKFEEMTIRENDTSSKWKRPVVILADRYTYSAANFFVNCMTYAPNATIVGQKTGGGGGMPLSYELPNGWLLRFSSVKMFNKDKQSIEDGINPNVTISNISSDKDDSIEEAIKIINKINL